MKRSTIPQQVKEEIEKRIEKFNKKKLSRLSGKVFYLAEFKGKFLYLKRKEFGDMSPIARLTYTGDISDWDFAIFKWSREKYDPDEFFFPGAEDLDGTIEGAMKAGLKAYPVE